MIVPAVQICIYDAPQVVNKQSDILCEQFAGNRQLCNLYMEELDCVDKPETNRRMLCVTYFQIPQK